MKKLLFNIIFVITVLILLSSCSTAYKLKKENKKYDKFSSGFRHNTYTTVSKKSVSKVVKKYNERDSVTEISEADVHSYIGFLMLLGKQNRFAVAEADIILWDSENIVNKYAAQNIITAVKYNKGWELSAQESKNEANMIAQSNPEIDSLCFSYYSSELIQAYAHLQQHDFVAASADFSHLSVVTGYIWPATLSSMLASIQVNDKENAYILYEQLLSDEETPVQVKKWLRKNAPDLIDNPQKLNNIGSSIDKMIRVYINGKFTIEAVKGVKVVAEECVDVILMIVGGIK